jgi:putative hydrolase of the HAD superfamily
MAVRVVTVDLWNTLVGAAGNAQRQAARLRIVQRFASRQGIALSEDELRDAFRATWRYYTALWLGEQRTPTPEELTAYLLHVLRIPAEPSTVRQLAEELACGVLEYPPPLLPGAYEALLSLAERYRLGLVSDTAFSPGHVLRKLLSRYGVAELFAAYSFSDETGVAKPHPQAYRAVLDALHTEPHEALHIGDLEQTDIRGAKQLGMYAILFCGDPETEFPPPPQTMADSVAAAWHDVPELVAQLCAGDRGDARTSASG